MRFLSTFAAFLLSTGALHAQSFNIDFGDEADCPSSSYEAAGLPGLWNAFVCYDSVPDTSAQPFDDQLVDLHGWATNVSVHEYGGTHILSANDPSVSGDDAKLLNDGLLTYSIPIKTCLYFNGLQNGDYEVLTYAWMPNQPSVIQRVFHDNTVGSAFVGGTWTGAHVEGVTYGRHIVTVTNGFMGPHIGIPNFGNAADGGALNGMQLRQLTCTSCVTSVCDGDGVGGGAACPCANNGATGRGCRNSSVASGAVLTTSGLPRVSEDSFTLVASGVGPSATTLFFQGSLPDAGGAGMPLGDGVRCVSGSLVRLKTRNASSGVASFGAAVSGDPLVSERGHVPALGGTLYYQAWYRDVNASFCTSETFNLTNGIRVEWQP